MTENLRLDPPIPLADEPRVAVLLRRAPVRVLLVSSDGTLTAELSTTLFAAGARARTSRTVADARRIIESAPEWPSVIAVAARLSDGTARDVLDVAREHHVDAVVLSEDEDDVDVWLGSLADVGVPTCAGAPDPGSPLAKLAAALRTRERDACRTALPEDVALLVARLAGSADGGARARVVAQGRTVVGDALFTLAADANRVGFVTSSRGASLACTFPDRRALVRITPSRHHTLALELSWHAR